MSDYEREQQRRQRHERKRQRLGCPDPVCAICGCTNLPSLLGVPFIRLPERLRRKLSEEHHLQGRKAGDAVVVLCLNCHAISSDDQYDWNPRLCQPQTSQERLAAFLQGLADFLRALGRTLVSLADALQVRIPWLLGGMVSDAPA